MNAYYDKTFVIDSELRLTICYYDYENEPLKFDDKFKVVDLIFKNLSSGEILELKNIGAIKDNEISILIYANEWSNAKREFFKDDISDLYGFGGEWHSYGVWIRPLVGNDRLCVMRGKAKLIRAK